jgi:hypothetical protein
MTGYTVHTGSTEKFAAGWDEIFKRGSGRKPAAKKKPAAQKVSAKASRSKATRSTRKKKR